MQELNVLIVFYLWASFIASPPITYALIPSAVCDVDGQAFNLQLCAIRLSATPRETGLPFGICDQNHPNFDDELCPQEVFIRAKIVLDEMRINQKRWVDGAKCQCSEQTPEESPLAAWERNTCNQLCVMDKWKKLQSEPFCDADSAEYDNERCEAENSKLLQPLQLKRLERGFSAE